MATAVEALGREGDVIGMPSYTVDHQWSQQHLSHYVEGELRPRARHRLDRHARDCVDCGRGIRAMRALVHVLQGLDGLTVPRAPATIFDRARLAGAGGSPSSQHA